MNETYDAIFQAVRSKISNGDIGNAVAEALRNVPDEFRRAFEIAIQDAWQCYRPSVLWKPHLSKDGSAWIAIYGDLATGVVGTGETPEKAMADFDKNWINP